MGKTLACIIGAVVLAGALTLERLDPAGIINFEVRGLDVATCCCSSTPPEPRDE